jgi:hypothetical protein
MVLVRKMMGKQEMAVCEKEHATAAQDGVSRAPDDRLAFKAASGCYDRIFCGTGPGVAGLLLACLCCKSMGEGEKRQVRRACYGRPR